MGIFGTDYQMERLPHIDEVLRRHKDDLKNWRYIGDGEGVLHGDRKNLETVLGMLVSIYDAA